MAISKNKPKAPAVAPKTKKETPEAKALRLKAEKLAARKAAALEAEQAEKAAAKAAAKKAAAKKAKKAAEPAIVTQVFVSVVSKVEAAGKPSESAYFGVGGQIIPRTDVIAVKGTTIYYKTLELLGSVSELKSKEGVSIYITENGPVIALQPSQILVAQSVAPTNDADPEDEDTESEDDADSEDDAATDDDDDDASTDDDDTDSDDDDDDASTDDDDDDGESDDDDDAATDDDDDDASTDDDDDASSDDDDELF